MITTVGLVLTIALLGPVQTGQSAPPAQDRQAADKAQVEASVKAFLDAFKAGNVTAMKSLFADNVLFVGDLSFLGDSKGTHGQRNQTRDELAAAYTAFFKAIGQEMWTGVFQKTTQSLTRATKGGHPADSKGELPGT